MDNRPVEPLIAPLVRTMNDTGLFRTIASCQGHRWKRMGPYVYFRSATATAATLQRLLREDQLSSTPRLHYYWETSGAFNFDYELCFRLHSPGLDFFGWWSAERLARDLATLQSMIAELAQLWQHRKPTVGQGGYHEQYRHHITEEYVQPEAGGVRIRGIALTAPSCPKTDSLSTFSARSKRHDFSFSDIQSR